MRTKKYDPATLTPLQALDLLKEGNQRFVNNLKLNRDLLQQVSETSAGQHPFAIILSCIDSRTSTELIFDQGFGDIFTVRIAGNCLNDDILGCMEFACKLSGSKLIMVLGHTNCGAITGACNDVRMGHLTTLLDKIRPAVQDVQIDGERNGGNPAFVQAVADRNVQLTMQQIPERSPILKAMLDAGEIGIAGGMYDLSNGLVTFMDEHLLLGVSALAADPQG